MLSRRSPRRSPRRSNKMKAGLLRLPMTMGKKKRSTYTTKHIRQVEENIRRSQERRSLRKK